jgi:Acyl-protein synthetase, LuxE
LNELVRNNLKKRVWNVSDASFEAVALDLFRFQAMHNQIYNEFLKYLDIKIENIQNIAQIPFMPIGFFKNHCVNTAITTNIEAVFESSGTTGSQTSKHYVADTDWYKAISVKIFENSYQSLRNTTILALLPSYLERSSSSLVYMVQHFMDMGNSPNAGFYLNNIDELLAKLKSIVSNRTATSTEPQKTIILWGVTFALLDLAEAGYDLSFLCDVTNLIVMETGGMKGRRQELLRQEVHQILTQKLGVSTIHSEYGMTELLSQAYSVGEGVFRESATLKILLRDTNDPFAVYEAAACPFRYGGVNVIDLANVDSCAFVETQDLGKFVDNNGHFEVIGRFDNSDVRGCNLMI